MGTHADDRGDLILAAQGGDPAALARLLTVCRVDARRYAYRHCHVNDVDDAVQETLLIVFRRIRGLRAAAAFSSWLFTVVKRECRKLSRMMFRRQPLPDELAEEQLMQRPQDELRIDLSAALGQLPTHYLQVVLLRDFEDMAISEIAGRLHEPVTTIKSRLHRARAQVRGYLLDVPT